MRRTTGWLHWAISAAMAAALAMPLATRAEDNGKDESDSEKQSESQKDEARSLKAFELEHRDPREIQRVLALLSRPSLAAASAPQPAQAPGASQTPGLQQPAGLPRTTAGYRGLPQDRMAVAVDAESGVVFVRGSEEQIKDVEKLIEAFDAPDDELEKHEFGDTRLIPIHQKDAGRVASILARLQLKHEMVQMGDDVRLIVLRDGESDADQKKVEQAEEIISKLGADETLEESSDREKESDARNNGSDSRNGDS